MKTPEIDRSRERLLEDRMILETLLEQAEWEAHEERLMQQHMEEAKRIALISEAHEQDFWEIDDYAGSDYQ